MSPFFQDEEEEIAGLMTTTAENYPHKLNLANLLSNIQKNSAAADEQSVMLLQ